MSVTQLVNMVIDFVEPYTNYVLASVFVGLIFWAVGRLVSIFSSKNSG